MDRGIGLILIERCDYGQLMAEHLSELEKYPEVAIMNYECLNICGMCSLRPFAIVNGKRIFADSIEKCIDKIRLQVTRELEALS